jgi:hypothetical protein
VEQFGLGLPYETGAVIVDPQGTAMLKGHHYLIDAVTDAEENVFLKPCGATAELIDGQPNEMLGFLKARAARSTVTSLSVRVTEHNKPIPDIAVAAHDGKGGYVEKTNAKGIALFLNVKPNLYRVSAAKEHYTPNPELSLDRDVKVIYGACASAQIESKADGLVTGVVKDAAGARVAWMDLEMVPASDPLSFHQLHFLARTNEKGEFRFEAMSPGRYCLGSNLGGLSHGFPVPPIYYPGTLERSAASIVEVKLGEKIGPLDMKLPVNE